MQFFSVQNKWNRILIKTLDPKKQSYTTIFGKIVRPDSRNQFCFLFFFCPFPPFILGKEKSVKIAARTKKETIALGS